MSDFTSKKSSSSFHDNDGEEEERAEAKSRRSDRMTAHRVAGIPVTQLFYVLEMIGWR